MFNHFNITFYMDKEFKILEQIQSNPHVNQRDLATIAQASLGMTNAILKRFVEKGFITIKKVNNRNIQYALTPKGMEEVGRRSWGYFKRTIKNVVIYRDAISEAVFQAKLNGYKGIVLLGKSDLTFIVEHECYKQKLPIRKTLDEKKLDNGWFYFLAENENFENENKEKDNTFSLNRIISNT